MIKAFVFDLSRTILFPKDKNYKGGLNALHSELSTNSHYSFLDYFYLDEDLLNYLESFKNKYDLYIFTSGTIQNVPEVKNRINTIFKKVFSAEVMGLSKKDSNTYNYIAKQINRNPDEILLVDDSELNIKAAKQVGFNVYLYSKLEELRSKLEIILER